MLPRLIAGFLAAALLLPVGQQACLYGWFALDNDGFTQAYCQVWTVEAPMCFGSCKITDSVDSATPVTEQLAPVSTDLTVPQYCQLRARPRVQSEGVRQSKTVAPTSDRRGFGRDYVGSVFWPPVG